MSICVGRHCTAYPFLKNFLLLHCAFLQILLVELMCRGKASSKAFACCVGARPLVPRLRFQPRSFSCASVW
ncbi:hypothetical protein BDV95DRAFT_123991 [Massariosphaeria phaeospora]|uniref:Secreted protein n=1 Tax=Massariosphaeria phaeospora TaxID=100035 RepID=A0A7C8IB79_9PLEO|nr:hypothetical protein BDV95DRAFT_123991 [Massariosphaeria phaeospora]